MWRFRLPNASIKRFRIMINFETTQWTMICAATDHSSAENRRALSDLCEKYWKPLHDYVYFRVRDEATAEDAVQAFITRLIEKDHLATADPRRGKFRAFLITAFKHFLSEEWRTENALKRGGGQAIHSMDQVEDSRTDATVTHTAEHEFERVWARSILTNALKNLETEFQMKGEERQFQSLKPFLLQPKSQKIQVLAEQLQMNPPAARMAVSRLRSRFRDILRHEIAQTVTSEEQIDEEIRDLFKAFQS